MLCLGAMNFGGAETFLMKLYRNIDRAKYQFDFCEPLIPSYYDDEILSLGGKIHRIPLKTENFSEYKRGLQKIVSDEGYQYVFRMASTAVAFMDLKYVKEAGARKCVARSTNSKEKSRSEEVLHRIGKIRYLKYVDLMLAPSRECGEHTFGKSNVRRGAVKILRNGLNVEQYQRDEDFRRTFRQENKLDDSLVVGHVGRFQKQKNHLFLIDVFNEIRKIHQNAKLLLVGEKKYLYQQVANAVESYGLSKDVLFLGERRDVNRLYSAMDALVFPSLYEGLPNVVVEAQAAGLPCLISSSITNEVVDTPLVKQIPLIQSSKQWACATLDLVKELKGNEIDMSAFKEKYDVKRIANWFQEEVFEK